jgi:hypothetical protein
MINKDSFSNGQVDSKLWLCQELEKLGWNSNVTRIYAGWYAVTALLLLGREKFKVNKIESYDIDPLCQPIADMLNENWVFKGWKFKAFTNDCNTLSWNNNVDLIINTSTEHFSELSWWNNIPTGTRVIIQSNNMQHDDHVFNFSNEDEFLKKFQMSTIMFKGTKQFVYPGWQFERYMLIGIK